MRRCLVGLIAIALLVASVRSGDAKKPDAKVEAEARRLYDEGTRAYNLGEYAQAIVAYKEAYRLVGNAYFLLNIAQAYRLSSDPRNARQFYKAFLNAKPDAANRAEIERRITEMEEAIKAIPEPGSQPDAGVPAPSPSPSPAPSTDGGVRVPTPEEVARLAQPSPTPTPTPVHDAPSRPIYKKWWFWTGLVVVAAGTTAAILLLSEDPNSAPGSDLGTFHLFD
ncbi:MAG: hypothetical protein IT370_12710 [Deltaproteobacteria bacterium]|nr:hypothetical protein [Deltaproteobacteria bacterium]